MLSGPLLFALLRTFINVAVACNLICAGQPLELVKPEILRHKVFEPILIMGANKVKNLDIRLRVKGGGHVSQVYGKRFGCVACTKA